MNAGPAVGRGTLLCVANFPANTGYAWDYIERAYARIADHLATHGVLDPDSPERSYLLVAGADEAGRGSLAGPLVVAGSGKLQTSTWCPSCLPPRPGR